MEMIVHLDDDIFKIVKEGVKNVEVRLNDEKRKKLKVGDTLVFLRRPYDKEKLVVKVVNLVVFQNFEEVIEYYGMERIYLKDFSKDNYLNLMNGFYSREEQEKYGVVAIEFEKDGI